MIAFVAGGSKSGGRAIPGGRHPGAWRSARACRPLHPLGPIILPDSLVPISFIWAGRPAEGGWRSSRGRVTDLWPRAAGSTESKLHGLNIAMAFADRKRGSGKRARPFLSRLEPSSAGSESMTSHYCRVGLRGEIAPLRMHQDDSFETAKVSKFSELLGGPAKPFRVTLDTNGNREVEVDFRPANSVAVAFFSTDGSLLTTTVFLSGRDVDTDPAQLHRLLDTLLAWVPARRAMSPLLEVTERPLILSFPSAPAWTESLVQVESLEVCLGCAFFRRVFADGP